MTMNNLLLGTAVTLSGIALAISGFTAYQVSSLRQGFEAAQISAEREPILADTPSNSQTSNREEENLRGSETNATPDGQIPEGNSGIRSGEYVQPAYGGRAEVELLSVKRIQDPDSQTSDVVSVQFRFRRLSGRAELGDNIWLRNARARNPETSEEYKPLQQRYTDRIQLRALSVGASADAYVWFNVREGVNSLDISIPETATFQNVPISS